MNRILFSTVLVLALGQAPSASLSRDASYRVSVLRDGAPMIVGSRRPTMEPRPVGAFEHVATNDGIDVDIVIGPRREVVVEGDDNLAPRVTTRVEDATLRIGFDGSYRTEGPLRVRIMIPHLDGVESHSSSSVSIRNLHQDALALAGQGSGSIVAEGLVRRLDLTLEGSGAGQLERLDADDVSAVLSGSGTAHVRADRSLAAKISGSGSIMAEGRVSRLDLELSGSGEGRLERLDADDVAAAISGSGTAHVRAEHSLEAVVSGSGRLTYAGSATILKTMVSAAGSVEKRD